MASFFIKFIYKLLYFLMSLGNGFSILRSKYKPFIEFYLYPNPNSLFINFKIKDDKIKDFEKNVLNNKFKLAKCRTLKNGDKDKKDDDINYIISANIYAGNVAQTEPTRCEYSVYIEDPNFKNNVSMIVVEALSSIPSYDTNDGFIRGCKCKHKRDKKKEYLLSEFDNKKISMKCKTSMKDNNTDHVHSEFVKANDRIYWLNGLYDKIYYDDSFVGAEVVVVNTKDIEIDYHKGDLLEYIEEEPESIFFYKKGLKYVVQPTANIFGDLE